VALPGGVAARPALKQPGRHSSEEMSSDEPSSTRQAARRSALDAQAALRKERADRERRLEGLAVAVLTALGERDGAVRDTERRAGDALQTMASEEGLSLPQAVEWWAVAPLRCGRCPGYGNSRTTRQAAAADERPTHAPPGHSNSDQAATLVGAAAAALCIQMDGRGKMMRSPNGRCSRHDQSHSAARNPGRTRFPWASLSFSLKTALHLAH
jgi:hypothetical protein